jgi:hypothetical protein
MKFYPTESISEDGMYIILNYKGTWSILARDINYPAGVRYLPTCTSFNEAVKSCEADAEEKKP